MRISCQGRFCRFFLALERQVSCLEYGFMAFLRLPFLLFRTPTISIALIMAMSGCAAPEYKRPSVELPQKWPVSSYGKAGPVAAKVAWRDFFTDPRLRVLIDAALLKNQDMRIAVIRVEEARATLGITSADKLPTVNLNASNAVTVTPPAIFGPDGKEIVSKRFDLSGTMVSYELDLWGRLANLTDAAQANLLSTEATRRSVRISLIAAVANTYYSLLEAEASLSLAKATVLNREMALEIVQQAFERGAVSQLEVLQAESVLEAAKSAVSLIEGQRASSENLMVSLVGRMPDNLPVGKGIYQSLDSDFMTGLPSEVLLARPDIVAVEQRLMAANANVAAARTAFLPKLLLTAGLGLASKSLSSLFSASSQAWNYTPTLSLPIFDGGRAESSLDLAKVRQNIAVVEYERAIQQAFREVSDLLAQRASTMEQARSAEASLKVQDGRLLVMQARHKAGASTYMDVLDALRDQFAAQRQLVQIRRGELSTAAQLFKALGGGDV